MDPSRLPHRDLTVAFHTFGCRLNQSESDSLGGGFATAGYTVVDPATTADLCVINTCSVTESAEADTRRLIRKILKKNPNTFLAVTWCYAQVGVDALRKMPGIDLIAGSGHKMLLPALIQNALGKGFGKLSEPLIFHSPKISKDDFTLPTFAVFNHQTRPNVKIQDGCDFFCSFCIIPYTRGRERSRKFDDVLLEVSLWAAQGFQEIVLTGVNLGEYSCEDRGLADLIIALDAVKGLARVRISSIEPTTVSPLLLDYMGNTKLCPHLHLPLQSGSNNILSKMGRRYTREDYITFVNEAMDKVQNLSLGADVMVGFPGEGEEEFFETVSLIELLPFAYLHVFPFSMREGTRLTRMGLQNVPSSIIRQRSQILRDLSKKKKQTFYNAAIGRVFDVLFENNNAVGVPTFYSGYTDNYIRVRVRSSTNLAGQLLPVFIMGVTGDMAVGVLS
ncbi:MAG: tRNA (N(6)-L-threonylcarbamoyladenosine(37)-C(2))-methylthiotransferase MtaB [Nitrospirae bacterium]|nr:tRNA (N(6)-L-threonylcarbamoyladenosine(37)-C(2))-methylthiotransferase MtaB [Candidatus Troglogloeales bacterium]